MTQIPLSEGTRTRLEALFSPSDREEAERVLIADCGPAYLGDPTSDAVGLERLRFAAMKVSGGNVDRLRWALEVVGVDWRDLLRAARFANDTRAHLRWSPRPTGTALSDWTKGVPVDGVRFASGQRVRVDLISAEEQAGYVSALLAVDPEPLYRVELETGAQVELYQSVLRPTG